jgi:hypothetical protein
MNFIELLCFAFAVFLSVVLGRYFYKYIGWWGAAPAAILGFGIVVAFIALLNKLLPARPSPQAEEKLRELRERKGGS